MFMKKQKIAAVLLIGVLGITSSISFAEIPSGSYTGSYVKSWMHGTSSVTAKGSSSTGGTYSGSTQIGSAYAQVSAQTYGEVLGDNGKIEYAPAEYYKTPITYQKASYSGQTSTETPYRLAQTGFVHYIWEYSTDYVLINTYTTSEVIVISN